MTTLGLDIGTTTVSAAVMEHGRVLEALARDNDAALAGREPWERLQDPGRILQIVLEMAQQLLERFPAVRRIGLTGQMHGIVYLDSGGKPVSPLFTWQDARAEQKMPDGKTYTASLRLLTGYETASGYGMATHYYNLKNGLTPGTAVVLCTIQDYVAMALAGRSQPVTDASDAASFGLFDVERGSYDWAAMERAGIDPGMLPALFGDRVIGTWRGRDVCAAIGDNQASFIGAGGGRRSMLVNVGTGSQFSAYSDRYVCCNGLETRPFPGGGYLVVGIPGGGGVHMRRKSLRAAGALFPRRRPDAWLREGQRLSCDGGAAGARGPSGGYTRCNDAVSRLPDGPGDPGLDRRIEHG